MHLANDTDMETRSAQETVHTQPEVAATAQQIVHAELEPAPCMIQCNQPASSSEVVVDSDSVYSVCCSDVTNDAETPDIVHVDYETPVVTGCGTTNDFLLLSFSLLSNLHSCAG